MFLRSGFAGARIKAISEEAGVNEALLYRHFDSKEGLYEAAMREPMDRAVDRLLELGAAAQERMEHDAHAYVIDLVEEMLEAMLEISPILGVALFGDQDRSGDFYREHFAPAIDRLSSGLRSYWVANGHPDVPARLVVEVLMGTALFVSLDERLGVGDRHEVVVAQFADALLKLVLPPGRGGG